MAVINKVDRSVFDKDLEFYCPGCKMRHSVRVASPKPFWQFNGDYDKPTLSPSVLVNKSHPKYRCHSFVKGGNIQFLNDCFHDLAGQTVPLPVIDADCEPVD